METKHTPGPWEAYNSDGGRIFKHWRVHKPSDKRPICQVADNGGDMTHANAKLIAAAPDLLAAMEALASSYDCCLSGKTSGKVWREVAEINLKYARAAIAKATT